MHRLIWTVILAFSMTLILGPVVIPLLRRLKFGQTIYDLGPESHKAKQGVPTMGGVFFSVSAVVASVVLAKGGPAWGFLPLCLVCAVAFGLVGFVDDLIKVTRHRSLGLTPMQKLVPQILFAAGIAVLAYLDPAIGSGWYVPFFDVTIDLSWAYIPIMVFVIVGTVNSANLLDGLDGLLGGCSMFDFATFSLIAIALAGESGAADELWNTAIFACAMTGALLGFLRFNTHPASVFMGDTGSFFIGGALVGIAIVTRMTLLLPVLGLAMVASSLSDILQVLWCRTHQGRRLFRMAPLHHHFELSGMPETRVVSMYYIVTVALCLLCLLAFA